MSSSRPRAMAASRLDARSGARRWSRRMTPPPSGSKLRRRRTRANSSRRRLSGRCRPSRRGRPVPRHFRERFKTLGPSNRPDLGKQAGEGIASAPRALTSCIAMTNSTSVSCASASRSSATRSTRRLAGELTEDQFKPLRLMNGLYLQLHAYMLRIAIPYGTLNVAPDAQARPHRADL